MNKQSFNVHPDHHHHGVGTRKTKKLGICYKNKKWGLRCSLIVGTATPLIASFFICFRLFLLSL
jgi:hypothetical protein